MQRNGKYKLPRIRFYILCFVEYIGVLINILILFDSGANIFAKFKKFYGVPIPACLVSILENCGFADKECLKLIDDHRCDKLEIYINKHKQKFTDIIKNTVYANQDEFELLPGHRALLLELPKKIREIESKKKNRNLNLETIYFDENGFTDENQIDDSQLDDQNDEIIFNEAKTKLIEKITNYWNKKKIECTELTLQRISNFNSVNGFHHCKFQCPFCMKKIPCTYKKYWEVGNLQAHLKTHIVEGPVDQESNGLSNQNNSVTASKSNSINILSAQQNTNVLDALNDVN